MLIVQLKCEVCLNILVTLIPIIISLSTSTLTYFTIKKRRKKSIQKINSQTVEVMRNKQWITINWNNLRVGDLIKLNNGDISPADIILLQTSDLQPTSVETLLLDGSSQLTPRSVPNLIDITYEGALFNTPFEIADMKREVYNDNVNIKNPLTNPIIFSGYLDFNGRSVELTNSNYIERYSIIHHSKFVIGGVVYTGHDCLTVNQHLFRTKPNKLERSLNALNLIQVTAILIYAGIIAIRSLYYYNMTQNWPFNSTISVYPYFMHNLRNYLILLLPLTPLELYSFIDLIYLFNSNVIRHLFRKSSVPNPNSLYELAHADVLMTSKNNLLEPKPYLKRIFINEQVYGKEPTIRKLCETKQLDLLENKSGFYQFTDPDLEISSEQAKILFLHLSLCHSASLVGSKGKFSYVSRFPDDEQLLRLAASSGYMLIGRTPDESVILIGNTTYNFKTKKIIHSSSNHPRISIIVEDAEGSIILFTRGVYKVMELIVDGIEKYQTIYDSFHDDGLHVECCSYRYLSQKQYKRFEEKISEFGTENADFTFSIVDNLEMHSTFLSIIGFEDQPREGTLSFLDSAKQSFKQIVLTSNSKGNSTVITGISLGIIKNNPVVGLVKGDILDDVEISITYLLENPSYDVLIIDGGAIQYLTQSQYAIKMAQMIQQTKTIVLQKADPTEICNFVRDLQIILGRSILGIGSTVYDCNYMKECDCSVSIGYGDIHVADISADIISGSFTDFAEILFVHASYFRDRFKSIVMSVFERNILFTFIQFWFNLYNGCSSTPLFSEPVIISVLYVFTFLPLFSHAVMNRTYSADDLMADAKFYRRTNKEPLTKTKLVVILFVLSSFSFLYLLIAKNVTMNSMNGFNSTISLKTFSFLMSLSIVVITNAIIISKTSSWSVQQNLFIFGSMICCVLIYLSSNYFEGSGSSYRAVQNVLTSIPCVSFIIISFVLTLFIQMTIEILIRKKPRSKYNISDEDEYELDKSDIVFENVDEY
ncbi:hypothetical protein TVAG_480150 [Trichomonas vaginalis G3]|uniref:Uncharacterized protein n=1 Tax=Trichomonas vaginalis (strain ATCC PRA-98 / G3) TaxID=412133 RepID=A2FK25_TRIV3|nr:phospholipid-translocating ATPase protein [Trichomonas vaginalis G3]EAX94734.1 hypothetical protein TVAG_480150 [Trichomonas vaginalis G3]KAI5551728.1 phospholipid-translocating ATPase protein [Trichomonas vaginalis G3]|eukprot:XP_001307664.1 hypothetical protein [Trichomonas vaginalis G3]